MTDWNARARLAGTKLGPDVHAYQVLVPTCKPRCTALIERRHELVCAVNYQEKWRWTMQDQLRFHVFLVERDAAREGNNIVQE